MIPLKKPSWIQAAKERIEREKKEKENQKDEMNAVKETKEMSSREGERKLGL